MFFWKRDSKSSSENVVRDRPSPRSSTNGQSRFNGRPEESRRTSDTGSTEESDVLTRYFGSGPYPDGALSSERRQKVLMYQLLMVLSIAASILAIAVVYLATTSRVEPFFVAVNSETGDVVDARPVSTTKFLSERMVTSRIEEIITGLRTVYTDPRATRLGYEEAWRYIMPATKADQWLRDYLSPEGTENPITLVGKQQRSVMDMQVTLVQGTRTYQVTWGERHVNTKNSIREIVMTGSVSILRVDLNDKDALMLNPIGLFVDGISFSETRSRIVGTSSSD